MTCGIAFANAVVGFRFYGLGFRVLGSVTCGIAFANAVVPCVYNALRLSLECGVEGLV